MSRFESPFPVHLHWRSLAFLLLCLWIAPQSYAQDFVHATNNPDFNTDLQGWNYGSLQKTRLPRASNGSNFQVRLNGTGGFGQFLVLDSNVDLQIMRIHAFRQRVGGGGAGSSCVAAVSYYDASWREIHKQQTSIPARNSSPAFAAGDGLTFATLGIFVPFDAVYAILFVWNNDPNTEIFVDDFDLLDGLPNEPAAIQPNLLVNPRMRTKGVQSGSLPRGLLMGPEFWNSSIDYSFTRSTQAGPMSIAGPFYDGTMGSRNRDEYAYQNFPVLPNHRYRMYADGDGPTSTLGASYGITFYDSSWMNVGDYVVPIRFDINNYTNYLVSPPNAAFASCYIYTPPCRQATTNPRGEATLDAIDMNGIDAGNGSYQSPRFRIQALGPANNDMTITMQSYQTVGRNSSEFVCTLFCSDYDELDPNSLAGAFYFTSLSDSNKRYEATPFNPYSPDQGLTTFGVTVAASTYPELAMVNGISMRDIGTLVIRPNRLKDRTGKFYPGKTFPLLSRNGAGFLRSERELQVP